MDFFQDHACLKKAREPPVNPHAPKVTGSNSVFLQQRKKKKSHESGLLNSPGVNLHKYDKLKNDIRGQGNC